jgi:hypothetical protein
MVNEEAPRFCCRIIRLQPPPPSYSQPITAVCASFPLSSLSSLCVAGRAFLSQLTGEKGEGLIKDDSKKLWGLLPVYFLFLGALEAGVELWKNQ